MKKIAPGIYLRNGMVYIRIQKGGEDTWKSFGPNCTEARRRARLARTKIKAEKIPAGEESRLLGLFERWAREHGKLNLSPKKLKTVRSQFRLHVFPFFGRRRRIASIDATDGRRFRAVLESKGLATATVHGMLSNLRAVLNFGHEVRNRETGERLLEESLSFRKVMPAMQELLPRILTERDLGLIARARLEQEDREVVEFLLSTGLRWGELQRLRRDQVRELPEPHLALERTKTKKVRRVPLSERARKILDAWEAREKSVLACPYRATGGNALALRVRRAVAELGAETEGFVFNVHRCRHTFATTCTAQGMNVRALMEVLGHQRIETTLRYVALLDAVVSREARRVAPALDRLGSVAAPVAANTYTARKRKGRA